MMKEAAEPNFYCEYKLQQHFRLNEIKIAKYFYKLVHYSINLYLLYYNIVL